MGRPWRGITGPAARPDLYVGSGPGGHGFDGDVADVAAWSGQRFLGQAIEGVAADARTSDWPDTAEETARLERFGQARKIAYMLNRTSRDKACKPGTYGAFHGIRFLYVNEETVPKGALDGMDAIHMPGGDAYPLPPETVKAIQEFVRNGGGYVGICAGALYAKADLLNILPFEDRGPGGKQIAIVELDPAHPISRGIESTIHLVGLRIKSLRYGGPWMEPLAPERTRKVGWFAGDGREGAILAGEFGKGRVVLFSNHPEFPAFDAWHGDARNTLQLRRLYRNAMYWAARFETGEDDAPRP
jgi:hypothetical protein